VISPVWISAGALYLPVVLVLLTGALRARQQRQLAACLLSALWASTALLAVQQLNVRWAWWTYSGSEVALRGMPLELYAGWIVLWGIFPQMLFRRTSIAWVAVLMIALDLATMPLLYPVIVLRPGWLWGEAVEAIVVLLPALAIARWTLDDSHLRARAALQVMIAAGLFLYLVPELTFALRPGRGWAPLLEMASWRRQLGLQLVIVLALPGLGGVMEFAERGRGTPIPYDPPKRLAVSGMYRYCANPMQWSCACAMLIWAALLRSIWLLAAAVTSIAYSAGIAEWDEGEDLARRFGTKWRQYRAQVRSWLFRWRPYHAGPNARLYVAASCGPCSELRSWLEARTPCGLEIVDAETLAAGSIRRMLYDPGEGSAAVDGVRALGRALEHLHLGWALAGTALRLPGVWRGVQLVMDASGLGPRVLRTTPRQAQ
jgi:protein-S-isoprenylcysteine O-methyltransferase Ste14